MKVAVRFVPAYWPRFRQLSSPHAPGGRQVQRFQVSQHSTEVRGGVREAGRRGPRRMASPRLALELSRPGPLKDSNLY